MKYVVLSDIHGNLEAFSEVIRDFTSIEPRRVICLGDVVGYGPNPDEVVKLISSHEVLTTMGNHEWGIMDSRHLSWFNPLARQSLEITKKLLSKEGFQIISSWPITISERDALFVHGCPPKSITKYLFEVTHDKFPILFKTFQEKICFVGHTHQLLLISWDGRDIELKKLKPGETIRLEHSKRYVINIGSVGQPRDGDNRAKYIVWDTDEETISVKGISYDIKLTVHKIISLGFPKFNADILW